VVADARARPPKPKARPAVKRELRALVEAGIKDPETAPAVRRWLEKLAAGLNAARPVA
jgi:hypothetical protein